VLTQRLEGLEAAGILVRRKLPPPAAVQVYELTAWGYESEPIFQALGRWGARSPAHDPSLPLSATSLLLSFRTMFDPGRAVGLRARIGFRFGEDRFLVHIDEGAIAFERAEPDDADLIITGSPPAVAAAVYGGQPFEPLESTGTLRLEGDRGLAQRFATLFPLPSKAGAAVLRP
jgi:putative sterol carrier protein